MKSLSKIKPLNSWKVTTACLSTRVFFFFVLRQKLLFFQLNHDKVLLMILFDAQPHQTIFETVIMSDLSVSTKDSIKIAKCSVYLLSSHW